MQAVLPGLQRNHRAVALRGVCGAISGSVHRDSQDGSQDARRAAVKDAFGWVRIRSGRAISPGTGRGENENRPGDRIPGAVSRLGRRASASVRSWPLRLLRFADFRGHLLPATGSEISSIGPTDAAVERRGLLRDLHRRADFARRVRERWRHRIPGAASARGCDDETEQGGGGRDSGSVGHGQFSGKAIRSVRRPVPVRGATPVPMRNSAGIPPIRVAKADASCMASCTAHGGGRGEAVLSCAPSTFSPPTARPIRGLHAVPHRAEPRVAGPRARGRRKGRSPPGRASTTELQEYPWEIKEALAKARLLRRVDPEGVRRRGRQASSTCASSSRSCRAPAAASASCTP